MSEVNNYAKVVRFQSQSKLHDGLTGDMSKENHTPNSTEGRKLKYGPDLMVTVNKGVRESPRSVDVINYIAIPYRVELEEREKKRQATVKQELSARQSQFDDFDRVLEKQRAENLRNSKLNHLNKVKANEKKILNELEQVDRRCVHENELKKREQWEKKEKQLMKNKQIEMTKNWNQIEKCLANFNETHERLIKHFQTKDFNKMLAKNFNAPLYELCKTRDILLKSIKTSGISANDVTTAEQLSSDIENLYSNYDVEYDNLMKKIAEDNEKQQQQLLLQEQQAAQKLLDEQKIKAETENKIKLNTNTINQNSQFLSFVSNERFTFYTNLQKSLQDYSEMIAPLVNDETLKQYRFDCQKAINIPVNAISATNPQHLIDKYEKLSTLLSGNAVKIGEISVSAGSHSIGKPFCMYLMAKKFVQQADTQISSNPKSAFPIAAVILALWQKFPDFGVLFLGHLHKECPYIVPYFIPQIEGQSTDDYLRLIGFHYVDGVVENRDLYLKRLSGIIRLYSAILITKPRREFMNVPHPHNLDHGWKWLTNLLNLDPLPDICATLILEFLQITGSYFIQNYGKQFIKLLKFIHEKYFMKLNIIDEGGPKARLEGFLMKIFKDGIIQPPEGILSDSFW